MRPESKTVIMKLQTSGASATEVVGVIDTMDLPGASHLQIDLLAGTASAAETAVTVLKLGETDNTAAHSDVTTDMTLIPAFTGAAAVSTSAGFVLPARSSTTQNIYRFNVDLLKRKRYIGCAFTPATTVVAGIAMSAILFRGDVAPAMATIGTATAGARLIVSG
jgi:hypothetical protein